MKSLTTQVLRACIQVEFERGDRFQRNLGKSTRASAVSSIDETERSHFPRSTLVCSIPTTTDSILPTTKRKLWDARSGASAHDDSFYCNAYAMVSKGQLTLNPNEHVPTGYRCGHLL